MERVANRAMQGLCVLAALLFATMVLVRPGLAAEQQPVLKGVALVIGQSNYTHLPAIGNPVNDAREIQKLLGDLGFEVKSVSDRDSVRLKRELDRFIEDAEGADAAFLYYAGHGIEAGGENWLVPVDADPSALDRISDSLVPVSQTLDRLARATPLSIVLLDACRTNPFPPGALARGGQGAAVPVSAAGLGRGATALSTSTASQDGAGSIIGFAAEPGKAALDGPAGANSPYAAALVRHLGAAGYDFGDVMTMVAQEVYLETSGRQQPWFNTGLRRFLYFGASPRQGEPDVESIEGERRRLLVTIAAEPADTRRLVEAAANSQAVPLGTLYGLLAALGTDAPRDPRELDRLLRGQTERLKTMVAERQILKSTDADIVRLSGLADRALNEGAIQASIGFWDSAKERVALLSKTVDRAQADIDTRRAEFADVYERSAITYLLAFRHKEAAADYRKAFDQVRRSDSELAWRYKLGEANALRSYGDYHGDTDALQQAMQTFLAAAKLLPQGRLSPAWAQTQNDLGLAVLAFGMRQSNSTALEKGVEIFRAIASSGIEQVDRSMWADAQSNLGSALTSLGIRSSGPEQYEQAILAYRAAQQAISREKQPVKWALSRKGEADAMAWIGLRANQPDRLHEALAGYEDVLKTLTADMDPLAWAGAQDGLGGALWAIGDRLEGTEMLDRAVQAYTAALTENTRERVPSLWATEQNNLGNVLSSLGQRETGTESLQQAAAAYRNALEEWRRDNDPFGWATAQNNLARTLVIIGERSGDDAMIENGLLAYREAAKEWTRESAPLQWASMQAKIAETKVGLGIKRSDIKSILEAKQSMQEAWDFYHDAGYPQYDGYFQDHMAEIDSALASLKAQ